jgi:hypothetical protein
LVKTELPKDNSTLERVNRFFITGEGNIKYTYNNGLMAKDPETAAMNFLRALEKLPGFVKQEQEKIAEIQKDLPILQEVVNGTWSKESRLSELKTELAAVERKIQLSITPKPNKMLRSRQKSRKKPQRFRKALYGQKAFICLVAYCNSRYFSSFSSIFLSVLHTGCQGIWFGLSYGLSVP